MSRRLMNKLTSALVLIGLGLVVALSAQSLPGQEDEEGLGDIALAMPDWFWPLLEWTALGVAALVAIYLVLSIRRGGDWDWSDLRRVLSRFLVILLWAGAFYFIYAITRPPEDGGSSPTEASGGATDVGPALDIGPVFASAWVAVVLIVLVIAAVIARAAMSASEADSKAQSPAKSDSSSGGRVPDLPRRPAGGGPNDRVINAYIDFESESHNVGVTRGTSETPRQHARRVLRQVGADRGDLEVLGSRYEMARFGDAQLEEDDASDAESALQRILRTMGL